MMKLSKESLHEILFEASMSIYDNAYKAGIALENGTLEIEGYERVEWIKFNPKDESTLPDNLTPVLICYKNGKVREEFHWAKGEFGVNIDPTAITHWHPLPPPPTETEAGK